MNRRTQVQVVAVVVVVVFAAGIRISGDNPSPAWLKFFSYAVTAAVATLWLWDNWLWRTGFAQRLKSVAPDVRGTWQGTLTSSWVDPKTGQAVPPKPAYLVVRQSASTVSATMFTNEMKSRSDLALVTRGETESSLVYMYVSVPKMAIQDRSRIHHGSTSLEIIGVRPARRLIGSYWTDRDSKGHLEFTTRNPNLADSYDRAADLFK